MKNQKYIIHAPGYSEDVGGFIVLHKLCDVLRKAGFDAYIWPAHQRLPNRFPVLRWYLGYFGRKLLNLRGARMALNPFYDTPLANPRTLKGGVVVYPEVVEGNPLRSAKVVRWFLNKPGRLTGKAIYGSDDLCVAYHDVFNDLELNPDGRKLRVLAVMSDIYRQQNFGQRSGTCFILRKGKARAPDVASLNGKIVDGLSHQEVAKLFNEAEFCISYDSYTMYSAYASMCGCKSIVVPEFGVDKAQWQPVEEMTYGIAYGEDDLPRALQTRGKMIDFYRQMELDSMNSVIAFTKDCDEYFGLK